MKKCNQCGACCIVIPIAQTKKQLANKGDGAFVKKHWKRISIKKGYEKFDAYLKKKFNTNLGTFKEYNKSRKNRRLYTCDCFDEKTGKCKHYDKRPKVCRDYPYYGNPPGTNVNRVVFGSLCAFWTKVKSA